MRYSERMPVAARLYGEVKLFQPMTILDVSRGGAQIETRFPLQLDSLHELRISLGEQSIVVKGRIAYCQIGELVESGVIYRTGLEFVEPSRHVQAALDHFLGTLQVAQSSTPAVLDGQIAEDRV